MTPEEKKLIKARKLVDAVNRLARKQGLNFFIVTDGASGISNNGNPAVRNAREAQIKWEIEHGADPYDDWSKKASSLDLDKLFPNSKFPTEDELKEKEKSFSVGDRVKVSDHIRCRQKGHVGTIVRIDPENKHGWKSFVVEFDDKKCGSMGFSSGNIDKVEEKKASSKSETYESGDGEVESFTPDKTDGHDEIVLRLKNGKKIVISNNTRIGIRVIPAEGDHLGYNGYHINGTNIVHKVHGNRHQRGGWLEHFAGF